MLNLKILVVDDDPITLLLLEKRLKKSGYDVIAVKDGEEAVGMLADNYYDVIITDMVMPGDIDGIGVLEAAKAKYIQTEVIVITAHASVDNAIEAMKKGAFDYLQKPINFDEVMLRVDKIINLKTLMKGAGDLRDAMDVTEKNAGETIQNLEIAIAQLQNKLSLLENVLKDNKIDLAYRIQKAIEIIS